QLHKGGAANGVFIQLSTDPANDLPIAGEPYTFGVLEASQALGDYESLASRGRRALRVSLGADVDSGMRTILAVVSEKPSKRATAAVTKKPAKRGATKAKSKPKAAKRTTSGSHAAAKSRATKKSVKRSARGR